MVSAREHLGDLGAEEAELLTRLLALGQDQLTEDWAPPGRDVAAKRELMAGLLRADRAYPGGLDAYLSRARVLLREAREGHNPFAGFTPERPEATELSTLDARYRELERAGLAAAGGLGVVLVAGGLGERLGYPGIKLDIPVEVTEGRSYFETYARWVRALGRRVGRRIPLVIMTSGQTHQATLESLAAAEGFGLERDQVTILRQELVPALADNEAHIAKGGPYEVIYKPHGHGDVHLLMHRSGTARRLARAGCTHLIFIQDTNAQVLNGALAALGVSVRRELAFNTVAVPRMAGEAVGAISRLVGPGGPLTINVEYNQLDALLRDTVDPAGDVGDERGRSPFPGNTNILVIALGDYLSALEASGGVIAEFVNPKYADAERSRFKSPTRLETMMQDLPRLLGPDQRVGVTIMDRTWTFSADKNALAQARAVAAAGRPPECAASAEADLYEAGRRKLALAGAVLPPPRTVERAGIPVRDGPRVLLSPRFALTLDDVVERVRGCELSAEATLVLDGDIRVEGLRLRGRAGLWVRAADGVTVRVEGLDLGDDGFETVALSEAERADAPDFLKIRGYRVISHRPLVADIEEPGSYLLDPDGLRRL